MGIVVIMRRRLCEAGTGTGVLGALSVSEEKLTRFVVS